MTHSTRKNQDRRWWGLPGDGRQGMSRLAKGRGRRRVLGRRAKDGERYVEPESGLVKTASTAKKDVRVWSWSTWRRR